MYIVNTDKVSVSVRSKHSKLLHPLSPLFVVHSPARPGCRTRPRRRPKDGSRACLDRESRARRAAVRKIESTARTMIPNRRTHVGDERVASSITRCDLCRPPTLPLTDDELSYSSTVVRPMFTRGLISIDPVPFAYYAFVLICRLSFAFCTRVRTRWFGFPIPSRFAFSFLSEPDLQA